MAYFKVVSDIDLSGNKLIDVTEIYRGDYDKTSPDLDLIIRAGSDAAGGADVAGGALKLYSGISAVTGNGPVNIIQQDGLQYINIANTGMNIALDNQPLDINTGSGTIDITSGLVTIHNDLWIKGNTTLGDGIGNDVTVLGSDFKVVKDDLITETLIVENQTGNTQILGTFLQSTTGLTASDDAYLINVDASPVFKIDGEGNTFVTGALYVYSTPIVFSGATNFTVGADDDYGTTARDTTLHTNTTIGSDTNAKTLTVKGDSNFSNITANAFTTLATDKATVNLFDTTPTTINAFGAATAVDIGSATGITTIKHDFQVEGQTDYLKFNTGFTDGGLPEGAVFYSDFDHALSYRPSDPNVTINIGQELVVRVRNNTGAPILNGEVVSVIAGQNTGFTPHVQKARANSLATSQVIGVATADIPDGTFGYVTESGIVRGLNTDTYTAGTLIYLSYTTAGAFTHTPPSTVYADAIDIRVGMVLNSTGSQQGSIIAYPGISWTTNATMANVKIDTLRMRTQFILASVAQTDEASVYWDDTPKLIKYHTGSAIKTVVDTDSTQDITNKTYNALTLTEQASGYTIAGGTSSKTLTVVDDVAFNTAFTLNTGALIVNANVGGSTVTFPIGHLDFGTLDVTDSSKKVLAIQDGVLKVSTGVETDESGNLTVTGNVTVSGDYLSDSATYDFLPDTVTTLNLADTTPTFNIGTSALTGNVINIGNTEADSVVTFFSTKNASAYTDGAVVIHGGVGIAQNIYANGRLDLPSNGAVYPIALGPDITIFRSNADELTIEANVILQDLESSNPNFGFAKTATTLNTLETASGVFNIGITGANTRQVNVFAEMQVGEASNQKDINLFGSLNVGGSTGFGIQYDAVDDSINFVKLT